MDELKQVIRENDVKVIAVTESWGQEWKEVSLEIEGFNMYKNIEQMEDAGRLCFVCEP